jgi:hypothetical protein
LVEDWTRKNAAVFEFRTSHSSLARADEVIE